EEIATGDYNRPADEQAAELERQVVRDRFGGSAARFREELKRYGLTDEDLKEQLLWQLTVLSFIDQRFRVGVLVTDEDVRSYYDQHEADLRRDYPRDHGF